jgi:hypothetical protein
MTLLASEQTLRGGDKNAWREYSVDFRGRGAHVYARQFFSNMDWDNLSYTLRIPEDGVNGIWQWAEEP